MLTRRTALARALQAAAAAHPLAALLAQQPAQQPAQQTTTPPQHPSTPDEMGLNTSQQQPHFPPPDFGPAPTSLPPATKALAGHASLLAHALKRGLISGAAVSSRLLAQDPVLDQLIAAQCGILVPEGELKWVALRPAQDRFDFSGPDRLFAFAAQHHMLVRGHTLVWHNSVPPWLTQPTAATNARQLLVDHIRTVMSRYRGRVHSWDVVNEAILPADNQPAALRNSFWYQHVGPDYIDLAFHTARAADPHAKLTYNDYGVETSSAEHTERRRLILDLIRSMRQRHVPLDAVGIQSHIKAAQPDTFGSGLAEYIAAIHSLDLEVYLTELDVNEDDIASNDPAIRDAEVAKTYAAFLQVALANPAVKLMLTWGVTDRRTWLNDGPTHRRKQPNRPQRSLPFDPQYRPTPAFFAIRATLDQTPKRPPTTPLRTP